MRLSPIIALCFSAASAITSMPTDIGLREYYAKRQRAHSQRRRMQKGRAISPSELLKLVRAAERKAALFAEMQQIIGSYKN